MEKINNNTWYNDYIRMIDDIIFNYKHFIKDFVFYYMWKIYGLF